MTVNYLEAGRTVPFGPFNLDFEKNECILPNGDIKSLSRREMQVLVRLSDVRIRSTEDIALSIAETEYPDAQDLLSDLKKGSVPVYICTLREKLGDQYILTKRGYGYHLNFK
jgi:DNA-binding response OmpR family regulator